jgi:EAL domain-containing protein (putative c-di-GMP-specific phosphodiesterase class I)
MASAREALYQAEEACRLAHGNQRNEPMQYNPALAHLQLRARQIEREIPDALENGEFTIAYQPQHLVETGALVGSEALMRWCSPVLGDVRPDEFIPIAESTGFIDTLGLWVLSRALSDLKQMPLDKIKLDKSFILGLGVDPAAMPILKAVSDLCRNLDVKLLCEGVETEEHLAVLRAHDCAEAQGFHFGRPLDLDAFLAHSQRSTSDLSSG